MQLLAGPNIDDSALVNDDQVVFQDLTGGFHRNDPLGSEDLVNGLHGGILWL